MLGKLVYCSSMAGRKTGAYVHRYDVGAEVAPGLYIGSLDTATNPACLQKYNINSVVNLSGHTYGVTAGGVSVPVHDIIMDDATVTLDTRADYIAKFLEGVRLIKAARADNKNVLVHCAAGINRSATLIAVYLISCGYTYDQAYAALHKANKKRGTDLLTNPSFVRLARAYEVAMTRGMYGEPAHK